MILIASHDHLVLSPYLWAVPDHRKMSMAEDIQRAVRYLREKKQEDMVIEFAGKVVRHVKKEDIVIWKSTGTILPFI